MLTMCSYEEGRGRSIHLSAAKPALSRRREERKRETGAYLKRLGCVPKSENNGSGCLGMGWASKQDNYCWGWASEGNKKRGNDLSFDARLRHYRSHLIPSLVSLQGLPTPPSDITNSALIRLLLSRDQPASHLPWFAQKATKPLLFSP